jgi:hypothetical protein
LAMILLEHHFPGKCYEEATTCARVMLKENNCDEFAHQKLIQIYTAQGLRHMTLQQYQYYEDTLYQELSIQPRPDTQLLLQRLFLMNLLEVEKCQRIVRAPSESLMLQFPPRATSGRPAFPEHDRCVWRCDACRSTRQLLSRIYSMHWCSNITDRRR